MKTLEQGTVLRHKEFSPLRPCTQGRMGAGDEGLNVSSTRRFDASPMLSAPHPQPFSPEYRGEGSKNLFVCRTSISNSITFLTKTFLFGQGLENHASCTATLRLATNDDKTHVVLLVAADDVFRNLVHNLLTGLLDIASTCSDLLSYAFN